MPQQQQHMPIMTSLILILAALTQVSLAAMSYQEKLCMIVNPALENCQLNCPDGKAWKNGCPVCACRSSLCQQKYCYFGQRCTIIQQQTGQYYNQLSDVAICQPENRNLATEAPTQPPTTPPATTAYLGSCDFQGRCDANGKCATADSVCRQDGLCCKVKREGYIMGGARGMARCMETPEVGQCRALGVQYVFNKDSGKCESMMYGGCVSSANSFYSMKQCQQTCEHPCQKPKTFGQCRASIPRYYFNENTEKCEAFDLGGCAGTDNYFMTPWSCETHCKGLKKASVTVKQRIVTPETPTVSPRNTGRQETNERETLRDRLINSFKNQNNNNVIDRGNPTLDNSGTIDFKPRPQPNRRVYTVDAFGNIIYVQNPATFPPATTPATTTFANRNGNNNGDVYTHLGDRIRSAHKVVNNYGQGQVNYNNLRSKPSGGSVPTYQNRGFTSYTQGGSYQSSVDALRRSLARN